MKAYIIISLHCAMAFSSIGAMYPYSDTIFYDPTASLERMNTQEQPSLASKTLTGVCTAGFCLGSTTVSLATDCAVVWFVSENTDNLDSFSTIGSGVVAGMGVCALCSLAYVGGKHLLQRCISKRNNDRSVNDELDV